jgi:glycosyltransferase involved in cell wall biosynthesis
LSQTIRLERAPGSDLTVYSARRGGEVAGTVAIPTRDHVGIGLFISMMMADWGFLSDGRTVSWQVVEGSILPAQRNELVQRMQGDWILFIDADMSFAPDAIGRLVKVREEHDLDIVGGLCFQRKDPHQPTLYMRESPESGGYTFLETWDSDLVEVDGTGFAFILIHRRVFERMVQFYEGRPDFTWPSLDVRTRMPPPNFFRWIDGVGEDLRFCQDAKAAGFRVFVDTRIEISHHSESIINHRSFLKEIAVRDPEVEEARRLMNDTLGLPTMTAAEAKDRLG